jgi:hypothetical protein
MLTAYCARVERDARGLVAGVYVHGSIALGSFDPATSDVDIVTLLHRPATPDDLTTLATLHTDLQRDYPRPLLEVSYFQRSDLASPPAAIAQHPYYHDGVFQQGGTFEANPITWWLLQTRGITLMGTAIEAIPIAITWAEVRDYTRHNLNTYWRKWAYHPSSMLKLLSGTGIEWAVLGVLRLVYALRENDMTSKAGAGAYALATLPPRYHRIVAEAMRIRAKQSTSSYPRFPLPRALDAVALLRAMIREYGEGY